MDEIHTLIISSKYRPYNDGLSDYTYHFLQEMRFNFKPLKFSLLTSDDSGIRNFITHDSHIYPNIKKWDGLELLPIIRTILHQNPKNILVQYVPTMYARAGINIFFPWLLLFIRFICKKRITLMAHELHHPPGKNAKSSFIFAWHIWNLFLMSLASKKIFTTTENFVKILKRFPFNKNKVHQIAVGPNIRGTRVTGLSCEKINMVIFGSLHPSRESKMVIQALQRYFKENPSSKISIDIVGVTKKEMLSLVSSSGEPEQPVAWRKFTFHGKLDEKDVAALFSKSHFSLNFFIDGISSRRGSAIAALNLGLPIITNFTNRSDSIFKNQECVLINGSSPEDFNMGLEEKLKKIETISDEAYLNLREKAFSFVDTSFSWGVICKKYFEISEEK